jgi:hypothetical protein
MFLIFLLHFSFPFLLAYMQIIVVFAQQLEAESILKEGYALGLMGEGFVWIGGDTLVGVNGYLFFSFSFFEYMLSLISSSLPNDALLGNLVITPSATANTSLAQQFTQQMAR